MLRLVSDENIHGDIIRGLRRRVPGLDVLRVQEVGLRMADDLTILEWAAAEGRILITRDRNTLIGFAYDRVEAGQLMPGVLVLRKGTTIGQAIDAMVLAAMCSSGDEWKDRVEHLPL